MLAEMITGHADAAAEAMPAFSPRIAAWRNARLDAAAAARLSLVIGHRDLLASPKKD